MTNMIELARLARSGAHHVRGHGAWPLREDPQLERWARFLRFENEAALDSLAEEDVVMSEAKRALHDLSSLPSARDLAEIRRAADIERHLDRVDARKEGRAEGLAEGRATELRGSLRRILEVRGLLPTPQQLAAVDACTDVETLRRWHDAAITATVVEDVFA